MTHSNATRTICGRFALVLAVSLFSFSALIAQGIVTTDSITVGGPGALGCQDAANPPNLTAQVAASATMDFAYDNMSGLLTVSVENTAPDVPGEEYPVITRIWFNLPPQAITGLSLMSQSAAGGPMPAFTADVDLDLFDGDNPNHANCFGDFSVQLMNPGPGPSGGLISSAATSVAGQAGSHVVGPLIFTFAVSAANLESLTAQSFSNTISQNASAAPVNAAIKWQGAGLGGEESGVLGNATGCEPGGFVVGTPSIGNTIQIVESGFPGCRGCIVASLDPGPTFFEGLVIPIGTPLQVISSAIIPDGGFVTTPIEIPDIVGIIGQTVYFIVVLTDANFNTLEISAQFQFTILP